MKRETQKTNKTVLVLVDFGSPIFSVARWGTSRSVKFRNQTELTYYLPICHYDQNCSVGKQSQIINYNLLLHKSILDAYQKTDFGEL
jgi:hypothetical protein